jgi:hypothetical protein
MFSTKLERNHVVRLTEGLASRPTGKKQYVMVRPAGTRRRQPPSTTTLAVLLWTVRIQGLEGPVRPWQWHGQGGDSAFRR